VFIVFILNTSGILELNYLTMAERWSSQRQAAANLRVIAGNPVVKNGSFPGTCFFFFFFEWQKQAKSFT
jgi:hypothetical protein